MDDQNAMFTSFSAEQLAQAFPISKRTQAEKVSTLVLAKLHDRIWTDRFQVQVTTEKMVIPSRLYFESGKKLGDHANVEELLMFQCLASRSNDGFQRQRANRELLKDIQTWSAPYIIALMGEYVFEILVDTSEAITTENIQKLLPFVSENPKYWNLTKQRVMSYWNVYYRWKYTRSEYVGIQIIQRIDDALAKYRKKLSAPQPR
tara:strand:+ start:19845 stop:20456 length:612 start_codon:yes stop_codon:yes gene_type:complete